MRPHLLCRERLRRILTILERKDGTCSIRELTRTYGIRDWEVTQAAEAGWLAISERKPPVGRPSLIAVKLSECGSAKLPPWRKGIPRGLSVRHDRFALESICMRPARNAIGFCIESATNAYLLAFPKCKSRAAAAASASRLMKRPMIRAARLWYRRISFRNAREPVPPTPDAIYRRLRELGEL